jgi:hypothetical protein
MSLTPEQQKLRAGKLTASRVGALMSGDDAKVLRLWEIMTGAAEEDDLAGVWPVQLGTATEQLQLDWYERKTGVAVTRRGEVVVLPGADWAAATLDGWDGERVIECKHVGGRERRDVVIARYQPQFHWQMLVTGTGDLLLSLIEAANEPVYELITLDAGYAAELRARAERFMESVWMLTPPVSLAAVAAPAIAIRQVDMSASNAWAHLAGLWLNTRDAAKQFAGAADELRQMVPADASVTYGHGVEITRDRARRLTIRGRAT